jgi:DNA-directed RNA polymerase subunit delta
MALKTIKEKKASTPKNGIVKADKASKSAAKKKDVDEDDLEDEEDLNDDWEKTEEDTSWDPDFEEFDLPKKASKKPGKFKPSDDDDDFNLNDDLKDIDDDDLFDDKDELEDDF